jgi:hypothetical protein
MFCSKSSTPTNTTKAPRTPPDKPNVPPAGRNWGTYQTAGNLRVPHHPRFDGLPGHGAIGVSTCRRASRLTGGGVNAGSENDGNFAPGGSGISASLQGIRGCGWVLL